jgi:hypothetical protein
MAARTGSKSFTVRFPDDLHHAASDAAARREKSLNALLQEITEAYLRQEEERELFDSFTRLGEDLEECDVEFAWDAQREAIDRVSPV